MSRQIHELCRDDDGEPANVKAGGADIYSMPRQALAHQSATQRRNSAA